jgi:hypothetical protein
MYGHDSQHSSSNESFEKQHESGLRHSEDGSRTGLQPFARVPTHRTIKEIEADSSADVVNLPFRTLSQNANLDEYVEETIEGVLHEVRTNKTGQEERKELVTFTINDKENPKNWSKPYKWWCTMTVALVCFCVAFNSAVITSNIKAPAEEFHVSEEVALLSVTVYVIGFGIGPLAFAPLSEIYGRWIIYATTLFVATVFIIPGALAKNITTLLVTRAISGIFVSAPMTLVGGTLADMWKNEERGIPMAAFSAAPFCKYMLG